MIKYLGNDFQRRVPVVGLDKLLVVSTVHGKNLLQYAFGQNSDF